MNKKNKTIFVCSQCDAQFPKWFGQCPECGAWGTIAEQSSANLKSSSREVGAAAGQTISLDQVEVKQTARWQTGIQELDRVLGGGIVPGSVILLGGAPGVGKSTLVLQLADQLARQAKDKSVLYISGEESGQQVKLRLERLGISGEGIKFLQEINTDIVCATTEKEKPTLVIVDSIQTVSLPEVDSEPGSLKQVRASTSKLLGMAKQTQTPVFIIGHVTKEGTVAGPKTLEHLVDTVLYLEGDPYHHFRLLRAVKNRFGATNEVGVFAMKEQGLVEVADPSQAFLANRSEASGSVVTAVTEGSRSFLIEVQALVSRTHYGYPQRKCSGFDLNRLQLLIAVLKKRCKISLGNYDVHINVAGGLAVKETAADLAVALAIVSALQDKILNPGLVVVGEVGLGGEIRSVSVLEKRIKEAAKMGFKEMIIPQAEGLKLVPWIKTIPVKKLNQAIGYLK